MLEAALAAGIAAAGGDALIGGVLPTPAASVLVRRLGLDLAAVISASHNPWRDNGIKFFGADGRKLGDDAEARIEAAAERTGDPAEAARSAGCARSRAASTTTCASSSAAFRLDLSGLRGRARLRERRDLPRRAGDLRPARRRGR